MTDLPWWKKAGIGALGGLALAILKLIDAKFFLAGIASVEAYAGYLTYGCYMLLGSVAAVFLADHELPPPKVRRSAFILGLLAPSVLLAIANQPFKAGSTEARPTLPIPSLGWLPLASAMAQGTAATKGTDAAASRQPRFEVLPASALKPSFADAISAAVGRTNLDEPYAYVVGSTTDKDKAWDTATKMQSLFKSDAARSNRGLQAKVIQLQGQGGYFVVVGELGSKQELSQLRIDATSAAIKSIGSESTDITLGQSDRKALADLLVNAPVLPARNLSTSR